MVNNYAKIRERDDKGRFIVPTKPSGFDKKKYQKEYNELHREERIAKSVEWGRKNKERRKIIKDRWRAKNKEKTNFLKRLYLYRKKNASGRHSLEDVKWLYSRFPKCAYCGINKSNTIDHVIPLSREGSNDIGNLIAVCVSCNSEKGAKTLSEWNPMLFYMFNQIARTQEYNK